MSANTSESADRSQMAWRSFDCLAIAIIALGAIFAALPLLLRGPHPMGHDLSEHLNFNHRFNEQFWRGELYPRWLMNLNFRLGSPTFFVFPPFQAFVYALLDPITRTLHLGTFVTEDFLAILVSGVCAYVWLRNLCERQWATLLAVLYMLAPYHLEIDFYRRAALPECWALAWIPLLIHFTWRIFERRRCAMPRFALVFGLLILSHMVSVAIISLVPIAAAFWVPESGKKLRALVAVIGGMLLGAGLASFYLLSALANAKYFPTTRFVNDVANFFISRATLSSGFAGARFIHIEARTGVIGILVCAVCGAAAFLLGNPSVRRQVIFFLAVCVVPAFLLFSVSGPIWRGISILASAVQYPFRLNMVLCVAGIALLALTLSRNGAAPGYAPIVRPAVAFFVTVCSLYSYWTVWTSYRTDPHIREEIAATKEAFVHDGWFLNWVQPGTDQASAIEASTGPQARFMGGQGLAQVVSWEPRHLVVETDSVSGGELMVNQFYYPAWKASLDSSSGSVVPRAALPQGLLAVDLPPGHQQVRFDIPASGSEIAGRVVSLFSLILFAAIAWFDLRRPEAAG